MTFFQRFRTPFSEGPADDQARYQPRMRMVGELLQERREDLGLDLDEIGAMLRIKPAYLAALEQGRTHDLPGPTYAIGFVRAYADFLGLDSEAVLTRFKAEAAGVTTRPDLALPVPLGERSLPGGALVLVALIIGLCGYGIWYYRSTEERSRPERVASVPASLQTTPSPVVVPPAAPPPASEAGANSQTSAPPSLYGAAASPATPSSPALPAATPPPSPLQLGTSSAPASSLPAQTPASGNLAPGALLTPIPRNAPQTAPTTPQPVVTPPPASPPQPAAQQAAPASPPVSQTASAAPAATPPATVATGGRITIKAINDCWIQVRAADQSIVFSRVLKAGETYTVPQRSGLSLRTGNAGALEVAVDGKTAPSIGGIGALRRDVQLDPAELAAGTAVHG